MTSTISPADEACIALVDRINAGTSYVLGVDAKYSVVEVDPLEQIDGLRVDLVASTESGETLRLDGLDDSVHEIRVWIRKQLKDLEPDTVQPLTLLRRQILDQLDNWDSADRRVRVWDTENEDLEQPLKGQVREQRLFVACIVLHVRVLA